MGNSCSLDNVNKKDKFFVGDAVSKKIITRDSSSRGTVIDVKVSLPAKPPRRPGQRSKSVCHSCRLSSDVSGLVIKGASSNTVELNRNRAADISAQYEDALGVKLNQVKISDNKATQLLLVPEPYLSRWWVVPARQQFTRHSGTCIVIGDKYCQSTSKQIKVGDFIRLGSVGMVVTETHDGTEHLSLSEKELDALSRDCEGISEDLFDTEVCSVLRDDDPRVAKQYISEIEGASLSTDDFECSPGVEIELNSGSNEIRGSLRKKETLILDSSAAQCYMCFDGDEDSEDPLVAPCECKGATKYVHVSCLQKWHSSKAKHKACIISNQKGAQVCGVCKTTYKTHRRSPNGECIPLLKPNLKPPYISMSVCTRHQHQRELFSTRFHLSFGSIVNRSGTQSQRSLIIGRSQTCDMVLQYRTVSTYHASVSFMNGGFYLQDLESSNGSYFYVREPLSLNWGESLRLRWGRGTVTLRPPKPSRSSSSSQHLSTSMPQLQSDSENLKNLLNDLALALPNEDIENEIIVQDEQRTVNVEVSE